MNTLLELLGVSVIGSLLIFALISSLHSTTDITFTLGRNLVVQKQTAVIVEILNDDLSRLGRRVPDSTSAIITADSTRLEFLADIDGNNGIDTIRHYVEEAVDSNGETVTVLKRRVSTSSGGNSAPGSATIHFQYFDVDGNATNVPSNIRLIEITLQLQDYVKYKDGYAQDYLKWRMFLKNIK